MPFRFKRKESVSEAIARTATELINKSVVELRGGKELESIHTVRKNIKKIRALLRLARGSLGRKTYRTLTDSLREAAEQLAATRDAHVKLQALEAVESHYHRRLGPRSFAHLKKALRQDCFASVREFDNRKSGGAVKRILKGTSREFQHLSLKESGWRAIARGVHQSFRCGRKALAQIRDDVSDEDFHEWRKRVKDLWYQARLLRRICPEEMRALASELKALAEHLGDDHDLVMLNEAVEKICLPASAKPEIAALKGLISRRQRELRSDALRLGGRVYKEKPARFCKRLASWWNAWRHK